MYAHSPEIEGEKSTSITNWTSMNALAIWNQLRTERVTDEKSAYESRRQLIPGRQLYQSPVAHVDDIKRSNRDWIKLRVLF
jgi:hypothetical protein